MQNQRRKSPLNESSSHLLAKPLLWRCSSNDSPSLPHPPHQNSQQQGEGERERENTEDISFIPSYTMNTNEKQNPEEKVKPLSAEVVLLMDQPKQSPSKYPIPIDPHTPQTQDKTQTTTTTTTRTLRRLQFSKPKSRFVEFNQPYKPIPVIESHDPNSAQKDEDEDEEELFKEEEEEEEQKLTNKNRKKKRKVRWRAIAEWSALVVLMACLVTSRTVHWWKHEELWGLAIWKWYLMALVILCGRLVSGWLVGLLTFIIERHFLLREKVLYFVYGLRNSVRNCIWLGLVLLAWYVMFDPEVLESTHHHRMVWRVWRALIAVTIGAVIWLVKIILVKVLASSFHVATFFDRMKESVFLYVVLEKLSGLPIDQDPKEMMMGRAKTMPPSLTKQVGSKRIDIEKLRRLTREKPSAYSVKRLVSHVRSSGLSTISTIIDETMQEFKEREEEITSEWEARSCAQRIFKNVAKDGAKYIEEGDLLRFLEEEEVHTIFPLFEGAMETGKINKSAFKNWMVRAYLERKALAHSLNDTKTAVQQLHKLASAIVVVIIIVMSLLVMGVATTKVVFVVTSQLVLAGFMFGNTCKTIFESIIFVFVMHPFDVGDRCVIDGVQMVVEEMNILTTVFLRFDNEKIYYPNSALLTKPISNFKRSPEMGDSIKFGIDASTSAETFTAMKDAIRKYIESKPKHWQSKHSVTVEEIENLNKMKITLYVIHTINHQNIAEKNNRRSELVFELKKIFEIHGIKYHLLPQEVHLSQVCMPFAAKVPAPAPTMII